MKVPFVDLRPLHGPLRAELDAAIAQVLDSEHYIGGPQVVGFESALSQVAGGIRAIGVSSGTDALLVSLMALNIGPGDEVVTTPFSFFATAGVIARLRARPVFADIEPDTFNLDPAKALSVYSERTKAVIPVHLYGRPATLPANDDVPVIEDAAQSIGAALVKGLAATLSFFPTKNLGAMGDGGAVITNDEAFADRVATLRKHGAAKKYFHDDVGGNFRLDAIQAAILRVKLPHLAEWTATRRANAAQYRALAAANALPPEVILPADTPDHIYNQFVIRAPRRDQLRAHLAEAGIGTVIYYPRPFHLQACFADLGYEPGAFPEAEKACNEVLALPIFPGLTAEQQSHVIETIAAFYR